MRGFVERHEVAIFFVMAFAGSWLPLAPMVLGREGLGILPYVTPFPVYAALFLLSSFTGPFLAAVVLTRSLEGSVGVRVFFRRFIAWRVGPHWLVLAAIGMPLVHLAVAAAILGPATVNAALATKLAPALPNFLIMMAVFPALITWGEEPGWRGFALTRLQTKIHPVAAALVIGLAHGLWHLPAFILHAGPVAMGPFDPSLFARNTIAIMLVTVTWAWVFNNARQSILVAVLLHASFNATVPTMQKLLPGFEKQMGPYVALLYGSLAIVVLILSRGRLGVRTAPSAEVRGAMPT
ncbi:MAG TPA: CPBP family intramembrane glutamic endopeptidase [Rhizomicrobium sp.]|nr:CPBP family intramembrane glutamic endopeptidase [Rhizomicrobium sp.]